MPEPLSDAALRERLMRDLRVRWDAAVINGLNPPRFWWPGLPTPAYIEYVERHKHLAHTFVWRDLSDRRVYVSLP